MSRPPIIITGMHRSGTTLLTKLLEQCGIFLGSKKFMNEEAIFFQDINRWLLYQTNTSWDAPEAFNYINTPFIESALKAIEWRMSSLHLKDYLGATKALKYRSIRKIDFDWGWKDPVNSITLSLWMQAFPEAKIVNIIRNPIDVALSLKSREEKRIQKYAQQSVTSREKKLIKKPAYNQSFKVLKLEEGIKLALSYMYLNEEHLKNHRQQTLQIQYEQLLQDPVKELTSVLDFLQINSAPEDIHDVTSLIKPNNGYKFVEEAGIKEIFEILNLRTEFNHFNFNLPDF